MLINFEDITYELTDEEKVMAKIFASKIQNATKDNPQTTRKICLWFKERGYAMTDVRLRKIVNYLRGTQMLPNLIGGGNGYYCTEDLSEIKKSIKSLKQRAESQLHVAKRIADFYKIQIEE